MAPKFLGALWLIPKVVFTFNAQAGGIQWPINWQRFLHTLRHLKIKASINCSSATSSCAQRRDRQHLIAAAQKESTCWDSHAHKGWTRAGDLAVVINPGFNQPAGKRVRFNPLHPHPRWSLLRRTSNEQDAPLPLGWDALYSPATLLGTIVDCLIDSNSRSRGHDELLNWNPSFRIWKNLIWVGSYEIMKREVVKLINN